MNHYQIAVTGHTSGLGKEIFDHFTKNNLHIEGFSRTNGFDLTTSEGQKRLLKELPRFNLFINNAHAGWAQTEILYSVFKEWRDQEKTILNIGSLSSDNTKNFLHPYAVEKASLEKASAQLNNLDKTKCKVTLLQPGWIRNERTNKMSVSDPMLSMSQVIQLIEYIINLPKEVHIPSVKICSLYENL